MKIHFPFVASIYPFFVQPMCVSLSYFQLCAVLLLGLTPQKTILCRLGGSCFVSSHPSSPKQREPAEDQELRVFFFTLVQYISVRFCSSTCLQRGNYCVNVSLSYLGIRHCCWDERSGYRGENSKEMVSYLARELLGSPFSPGCEYCPLLSGSGFQGAA